MQRHVQGLVAGAAGLTMVLLATGCSSGDDTSQEDASGANDEAAGGEGRSCDQAPTVDEVVVEPVEDEPSDLTITSFDGTLIRAHWFPAADAEAGDEPVPTVLMGPGWGQPGATESRNSALGYGETQIAPLRDAGYNVLTWDPRGFGESTGEATVDDAAHEGRDVQVLLDWVAGQPEALLDRDGDARVGMIGGSYGGGIQLVVGAMDCRVDALAPGVAWNSLETSLYPQETVKSGWGNLLIQAADAFGGRVDAHVSEAADAGLTTGVLDEELVTWFADRGPGDMVQHITAPTLIVHGTVDNLFTPSEGVTNFRALQDAETPVAMLWYCGGHGICLTGEADNDLVEARTHAWLDRHLKGNDESDTGPVMDIVDQNGDRWVGDDYPAEPDDLLEADSDGGTLALTADSQAGPVEAPPAGEAFDGVFAGITPTRADEALELTATAESDNLVVGSPHLSLTYRGTAPDGPEPTRVFAQLVDDETGHVLGNQIVPVPLTLDGEDHTVEADLEVVAHHLTAGDTVTLQLVATTPVYATPRLGGELTVTAVALALPTTEDLSPAEP